MRDEDEDFLLQIYNRLIGRKNTTIVTTSNHRSTYLLDQLVNMFPFGSDLERKRGRLVLRISDNNGCKTHQVNFIYSQDFQGVICDTRGCAGVILDPFFKKLLMEEKERLDYILMLERIT